MRDLPSGTVTFLFTDIEGSTELLAELGERYGSVLATHDRLMRAVFDTHGGHEVDHAGDGFFVAFASARQAVAAAIAGQRSLCEQRWPAAVTLRVRMGLHTGEAAISGDRYVGVDVHRAARIGAAAHGGQIVVSEHTQSMVETFLQPDASLTDLGYHRFKGFTTDEHLYQVCVDDLPDRFPPLRAVSTPGNLPVLATDFVGRTDELADIGVALGRPDVRLLTLTGPGGAGKTRLAIEAAARHREDFDGAYFVPLAAVRDANRVASTIAEVLGLRELGSRPISELLGRHLRDRHTLLILDNFEQVEEARWLVAELLEAAPRLQVLVTSRTRLNLYGEHEMPVRPMVVPERGADAVEIAQSEAVQLFLHRAEAVQPALRLTDDNAEAIASIVGRVDGLPLAIELAATRVRLLAPRELAARLDNRLGVLTGGASDLPDRQRTLRATIDWSYQLLDDIEQEVFRTLSCFVGGFTVEAAEAVLEPMGEVTGDTFEVVAALVDESLLWSQESSVGTTRFRMLETLREYARERLEAEGAAAAVDERHARYYLTWAERQREGLDGGDTTALARFDDEHDNVLAALAWAVAAEVPDAVELTLRLVTAMGWYWFTRGHTYVAIACLERALDRGSDAPVELRGKPLYWLGAMLDRRGDLDRARSAMEASVAAWCEVGDIRTLAIALNGLGSVSENQGDNEAARTAYEESLARFREIGDDHGAATVLSGLGTLASDQGQYGLAAEHLTESLRAFTAAEDAWSTAVIEIQLAWVELEQGKVDEAARLAGDATRKCRNWGEQSYLAACLELYAAIAAREEPRQAARLVGAAGGLRDAVGSRLPDRERRDLERHLALARRALGADFDAEVAVGAAASLTDVVDEHLARRAGHGADQPPADA